MFLDASVIVAILAEEPDAAALSSVVADRDPLYVSALARFEAVLGLARKLKGHADGDDEIAQASITVDEFLQSINAVEIEITPAIGARAIAATATYGKAVGHPAALNMGDCFAYACAKALGVPLLYKGNDFAETDLG